MKMYKIEEEEQCYKCNQLITETPMEFTDSVQTEESGEDGWEERSLCTKCYVERNKPKMLKNQNTGEERPLIRCGITRCNKVIHIGEEMGYDKNYDVFCKGCSDDMFVARGEITDDWISGDIGWEEVEVETCEGTCKGDSSVTDCYGDCGELYIGGYGVAFIDPHTAEIIPFTAQELYNSQLPIEKEGENK